MSKVSDLNARLDVTQHGGLLARSRVHKLLDENSFIEVGGFVRQRNTDFTASNPIQVASDGVVTGYGTIDGRLVYVFSQDPDACGGSIGEMHAKKIERIYEQALQMGAPVIGLIDSKGVRLSENVDALDALGKVFACMSGATGVIPQITAILGDCMGGLTLLPALSDFVFMTQEGAKFFLSSPQSIPGAEGRVAVIEGMGSGKNNAQNTGLIHFLSPDESSLFADVRTLMTYLPSNNMEESPIFTCEDDPARIAPVLNDASDAGNIDLHVLLSSVSDNGQFLEVQKEFEPGLLTAFVRFNGCTAGVIANDAKAGGNVLNNKIEKKATAFIHLCDAFNIPIVSFVDVAGFKASYDEEVAGLIQNSAQLLHSFASATVPKLSILLGDAFGSAYIIMNSKHIGADLVYAWPSAKVAVMEAEKAVSIMMDQEIKSSKNALETKKELIARYDSMQQSPYTSASRGYIDNIIEPSKTRCYITAALDALASKRVATPAKKHSSFN